MSNDLGVRISIAQQNINCAAEHRLRKGDKTLLTVQVIKRCVLPRNQCSDRKVIAHVHYSALKGMKSLYTDWLLHALRNV